MCRRILIGFLLISTSNLLAGCYYFKSITVPEYKRVEKRKGKPDEIYVKTKDGNWYHYTNSQYYIKNDTLYGYGNLLSDEWENAGDTRIALSNIESIGIEKMNYVTTGLLYMVVIGGIILSIAFFVWLFTADKEIHPY